MKIAASFLQNCSEYILQESEIKVLSEINVNRVFAIDGLGHALHSRESIHQFFLK